MKSDAILGADGLRQPRSLLVGMTFFLDESGSSGDVAVTGAGLAFGGQPIYVHAAVGTNHPEMLVDWLVALSAKHGLRAGEVKSTNLTNSPGYVADLADLLQRADLPVFVEVVDKRYYLVIHLLNQVIMPPLPGYDDGPGGTVLRPLMADLVHDTIPDEVLQLYADACIVPTREKVGLVFAALGAWAADHPMKGTIQSILADLISEGEEEWKADTSAEAHLRWLPAPDPSVTGKPIWVLPALSSLTNIYARINMYRGGRLTGVNLVHDEHMLYGGILKDAKAVMERLAADGAVLQVPHAEYALRERADMEFARSADVPGIQVADVIGGFVMRLVRDVALGRPLTEDRMAAMARILRLSRPEQARGINFVTSDKLMASMGTARV